MRISFHYSIITVVGLALAALAPGSSDAQSGTQTNSVVVAVFNDYPVFRPSSGVRSRRVLQAVVISRDLMDKDRSMIILNPDYVTPSVLFAAIARLNSSPAERKEPAIFTITRSNTPAWSDPDPSIASALAGAIRELSATQPSKLRGHPFGKHIVLTRELRMMIANASVTPKL